MAALETAGLAGQLFWLGGFGLGLGDVVLRLPHYGDQFVDPLVELRQFVLGHRRCFGDVGGQGVYGAPLDVELEMEMWPG